MKRMVVAVAAAALAVVGLAAPASADEVTYDLIASGGTTATSMDIGDVIVSAPAGGKIAVHVVVNGEIDPDNVVQTRVYGVSAQAECAVADFPLSKGNPVPGQMAYQDSFPDGTRDFSFELDDPGCVGAPLVFVHTDAKELGDWAGLNQVVKAAGPVQFKVVTDAGSDPNASYFDTTFLSGPFAGQTFDGYCVDVGNTIGTGTIYLGTMVSLDDLVNTGNIDKPENLPAVMWLLNNYKPGQVYRYGPDANADGIPDLSNVLTSGTIQRAIWYLVDLQQSTSGLGAFNDTVAQLLAAEALENNVLPASACGQLIPIVLVIDGQTTIGQTTLVNIEVPCETLSETAVAMNTAVTVTEKGSVRYGEQFPGSNWFSYVYAPLAAA